MKAKEKTLIARIEGGLGNQLFQYAFSLSMSKRLNKSVLFDVSELERDALRDLELGCFEIDEPIVSVGEIKKSININKFMPFRLAIKLLRRSILSRESYTNEALYLNNQNTILNDDVVYIDGYWQSEKYFYDIRSELIERLILKKDLMAIANKYSENIINDESLCVHIRRGDYVSNKKASATNGALSLEYYSRAIKQMKETIPNPKLYIFSDDNKWVRENMDFQDLDYVLVEPYVQSPCVDMYLMSLCKNFIIANSSYSWWGAWLSDSPEKIVIAPKKWFANKELNENADNIIPSSWLRM